MLLLGFALQSWWVSDDGVPRENDEKGVPLQSVHVCPPASAYAGGKLDVLIWWWICTLFDAVAGYTIYELELDVTCRGGQCDGITTVGSEREVEN